MRPLLRLATLFVTIGLAVMLVLQGSASPAVQVEASLNTPQDPLPFGKPAELVLTISWPETLEYSPPAATDLEIPEVHILDRYAVETSNNGQLKRRVYHLLFTRFEPGPFEVGPVSIPAPEGPVESPQLSMTFAGATPLESDKPDEIRGPKGVVEISTADFWKRALEWLLMGLAALCLLAVISRYLGLLDRFRSPKVLALKKLRRLHKNSTRSNALLLGCVEVLRNYLSQAYGLKTWEATSSEIIRQLRMDNRCLSIKDTATEILTSGDQIKFANRELNDSEADDLYQQLLTILQQETKVAKR